jgi:hypothetical protein
MAKLTSAILDEIVASFHRVGGEAYLEELAMRDPPTFCQLLSKVVQAEVKAAQPNATSTLNLGLAMAVADAQLAKSDQEP